MPLSGAERNKRYREKLKKERPDEFEKQRKKNLENVKSKKKKVSELTPEEAEIRREKWRKDKRTSRQKQNINKNQFNLEDRNSIPGSTQQNNNFNDILIRNLRKKCKALVNKCKRHTKYNAKMLKNMEAYRKRYQRFKRKTEKDIESLNLQIKKMRAREEMLESALKKTYQRSSDIKEKKTLKQLVTNSGNKSVITKMLGLKGKVREKKKKLRRSDISEITNFYIRDDISRNTAGKKEVRTKNKEKIQIRYLLDTLSNTFKKYKAEGGRYGFTTFYLHKPFFVLSPGLSSRSTCLCVKHSNFGFLHTAMVKSGLLSGSIRQTLNQVSCDINNYDCMWNKCLNCKDKKVQYQEISAEKLEQQVEWSRWEREDHTYQKRDGLEMKEITTKKTGKVTKKGTLNDLKNDFEKDLLLFKKHFFTMTHQQNQYQKAVKELKENEVVIVCDFSENYQAKLAEEIQAMHYGASNLQICLHTGMVFWKDCSQSFCTLSDNTSHQPAAIWAHLTPIIDMIKQKTPETTIIHFYSDGPSSQYRQKNNFYLLVHYTKKYLLQYTTWSFYEAGHGKNVADGIGGSVKRTLDRKVCIGNDVIDAKDAYNLLAQTLKATKVFLIDSCEIENVSKILPAKIPVLKGTMQLHQITTSNGDSFIIKYRDISCFCGDLRGQCGCFSPKSHSVVLSSSNINESFKICPSSEKLTATSCSKINQNVKVICEIESDPCLALKPTMDMCLEPTFNIDNLTSEISKIEQIPDDRSTQVTEEPEIKTVHESSLSLNWSSHLFDGLNNIEEPFDLNTIDIENLTFTYEDKDDKHSRDKLNAEDSWNLITNDNEQVTTLSHNEPGLLGNNVANKTVTSSQLSNGKNVQSLTLAEVSVKESPTHENQCFVDPKKIMIIPQVKRQPEKLLTGNKGLAKDTSILITKDTKLPASSLAKNLKPEKSGVVKGKSKAICKKNKCVSKITFLECQKCNSSILGQKGKCICCKNWFCIECIAGPIISDYICESCLI